MATQERTLEEPTFEGEPLRQAVTINTSLIFVDTDGKHVAWALADQWDLEAPLDLLVYRRGRGFSEERGVPFGYVLDDTTPTGMRTLDRGWLWPVSTFLPTDTLTSTEDDRG